MTTSAEEQVWLETAAQRWKAEGRIYEQDVRHFCTDYLVARLNTTFAPRHMSVQMVSLGHTGVIHHHELLRWDFEERPEDSLVFVVTQGMARKAAEIANRNIVRQLHCAVGDPPANLPDHQEGWDLS